MMRKAMIVVLLTVCFAAALVSVSLADEKGHSALKYPKGYRLWTHIKSMDILEGHQLFEMFGGLHHVYANTKAYRALLKGKPYPNGAVFVFDLLEAPEKDKAITEGSRKFIGVMEKNTRKYADTGGWGFEGFKGDTKERMVTDMKKCFQCHEPQKEAGYIFSKFRK
jgi:hypothetical protein